MILATMWMASCFEPIRAVRLGSCCYRHVTYYVNQAGRLACSLKASGIRSPGRGRPVPEVGEAAA